MRTFLLPLDPPRPCPPLRCRTLVLPNDGPLWDLKDGRSLCGACHATAVDDDGKVPCVLIKRRRRERRRWRLLCDALVTNHPRACVHRRHRPSAHQLPRAPTHSPALP